MNAPLIIGLGNPGDEYIGTRHNVGFDAVDAIARDAVCGLPQGTWRARSAVHAELFTCTIAQHEVTLAKPTTFMNNSGQSVAALVRTSHISAHAEHVLVIHDDLDLPLGALRLVMGGSSGGQKGVQSIIDALGTKDFLRLRIGIGPNATPDGHRIPAEDFVLKRFHATERPAIDATIARAVTVITTLLRDGLPNAKELAI